jgi:GH43 family beta-xylosidase
VNTGTRKRPGSGHCRIVSAACLATALLLASACAGTFGTTPRPPEEERFVNPLIHQRADPQVFKHSDGLYYLAATVPEYDRIELRKASTIQGLAEAEPVTVWRKHASGPMGAHIWAPEIHHIDGKWYIYFAAGEAERIWNIRMYVLESSSPDPLRGTWVEKGRIQTGMDSFSLDASTFVHRGRRYLVWAQQDPAIRGNTNLYIAEMENPWTIRGSPVRLSRPEYPWEIVGHWVNEGPAVLIRNGRVFMTYSASATDANYAMGLLTASADADLLDVRSWSKSPEPVFRSNDETGQYGPGHNSFTVGRYGQDVMIYHARSYREIEGEPLRDPNRHTRAQNLRWNPDGTPDFGVPVPDGPTPPEGGR